MKERLQLACYNTLPNVQSPFHYARNNLKGCMYLSFDFNHNPICCSRFEDYNNTIHLIRCIKLKNSNIYEMLKMIKQLYTTATFVITGDATGNNSTAMVEDNNNYNKIIRAS